MAYQAVEETSGIYMNFNNVLTYAFYVAGDSNTSPPACVGNVNVGTEHWVTYNEGQSGANVTQTELGWVFEPNENGYGQNRGCMSQWGARCLENSNGYDYESILRFYYGADINLTQAPGACIVPLEGDGDFRSPECVDLLRESDIVVTNPPFSLFREYVKQLFDFDKKFLIIGNMNAITYKEVFPLIKENRLWLGNKTSSQQMFLEAPKEYTEKVMASKPQGMWWRIIDGKPLIGIHTALWFTNLDHGRRHQPLPLMTLEDNLKYSKHKEIKGKTAYNKYDNYDAIEVPFTDAIPSNYDGVMGVPISFLDKYSPEQFEIIGIDRYVEDNPNYGKRFTIKGKEIYARVLIRHKKKGKAKPSKRP
jgi:hypothetical protein